jgi:hypothetical protein
MVDKLLSGTALARPSQTHIGQRNATDDVVFSSGSPAKATKKLNQTSVSLAD